MIRYVRFASRAVCCALLVISIHIPCWPQGSSLTSLMFAFIAVDLCLCLEAVAACALAWLDRYDILRRLPTLRRRENSNFRTNLEYICFESSWLFLSSDIHVDLFSPHHAPGDPSLLTIFALPRTFYLIQPATLQPCHSSHARTTYLNTQSVR